jgi:hypothetical protein
MRPRTKKDQMLRHERDRLTVKLTWYLASLGAQTDEQPDFSSGPRPIHLDSLAGRLRITCYGDWLACRFDDVERAKALLPHGPGERLNSHSGSGTFTSAASAPKKHWLLFAQNWSPFYRRRGVFMKGARDLSRDELVQLVDHVQQVLYLDADPRGMIWNPDKVWDAESLDSIAAAMIDAGLKPERKTPREKPSGP